MPEGLTLLPAPPGVCPQCAVDHKLTDPHNLQSIYYQYHFYASRGRWPTWKDAIEHCSPEIRGAWEQELRNIGAWSEPKSEVPDVLPTVERTIGTAPQVLTDEPAGAGQKKKKGALPSAR